MKAALNRTIVSRGARIYIILGCFLLISVAVISRLAFLQITHYGFYKALAQGQQNLSSFEKGDRGEIFVQDKHGNLYTIATNQKLSFVFVTPPEIENHEETANMLSEILQIDTPTLLQHFNRTDSLHEPIKRRISKTEEERIVNANMPGVYIGKQFARYYPHEALAAQTIGFVNQDGQGQYGVEEYYDDVLAGKEGLRTRARNPASYLSLALEDTQLQKGSDIILSIDFNIQNKAQEELKWAKEHLNVQVGTIIVSEIPTGHIVALANTPDFDPNEFYAVKDLDVFQNAAAQKIFEPGSVMKPITMAAALDAHRVSPNTTYVDTGEVHIGSDTIYNYDYKTYGTQTMAGVLEHSINTGAVFAERQLGHENFLTYLDRFALFQPTDIDVAGEIFSENKEFKKGYEINFATASFGQGIELNPLHLIQAYSALANQGLLVPPMLAKTLIDGKGLVKEPKLGGGVRVISEKAARQVTAMLVDSVEKNILAHIPGYYIAGKTGTAQVSLSALGINKPGYSEDHTIQSFISYFPAYDPQFLILVKLNNPSTRAAGFSAIPVSKALTQYIIDYYQIPPDYTLE